MAVRHAFSVSGATHSLVDAIERRGIAVTRASNATAAIVMASVMGRVLIVPGVALVDTVTADMLAQVVADRVPMIVVAGVASDDASVLAAVAKATLDVTPASAAHRIAHAGQLAMKDPRGAVVLALSSSTIDAPAMPAATAVRPAPLPPPSRTSLDAAARLLGATARPVIVAGSQVRSSSDGPWIRAFAETLPAPVVTTASVRGVLPEPHPLSLGVLDASAATRDVVARADLVIELGLDPTDAVVAPRAARVLRLARPGSADGGATPADATPPGEDAGAPVVVSGDIALVLEELAPRLRGTRADWDVAELDRVKRALAAERDDTLARSDRHALVALARDATPAGAVVAFDRGMRPAAAAWQCVSPLDIVSPSAATRDGVALAAAIAARLAGADGPVLCVTDVTGLRASLADLRRAVETAVDVVIVVANDTGASVGTAIASTGAPVFGATDASGAALALTHALGVHGPSIVDAAVSAASMGRVDRSVLGPSV